MVAALRTLFITLAAITVVSIPFIFAGFFFITFFAGIGAVIALLLWLLAKALN
jgi:hypothetical protein